MTEPRTIKHYELLSPLGDGGMGVVWRARDTRLGRVVALKMLPESLARDEDRVRRFEREAHLASAISHPSIATLYDFDRDGEVSFLTMELVDGRTLRELIDAGPLPLTTVLDAAVQIAEGLAAAHKQGVIHRDLKPENVVASDSGYYKILDFGVARREDPQSTRTGSDTQAETVERMTSVGTMIGTVAYMSPEQIHGHEIDARSDLFSFGALLYELTCGTPAFRRKTEIATAHAILHERPAPVRSLRRDATGGLAAVIETCLEREPDRRYPSTEVLLDDLRRLRDGGATTRTISGLHAVDARRLTARVRRRPFAVALTALAVLAVLAAVVLVRRDRADAAVAPAPQTAVGAAGVPAARAAGPVASRRVVVAPFIDNTGETASAWLSRGVPEMLTTDLAADGRLEVIASRRLDDMLAASGRTDASIGDRGTATELARWVGADLVVSGSIFRAADVLRLDAQAYDTATGAVVVAAKAEGEDVFALVAELQRRLVAGLVPGRRGPLLADEDRRQTSSPEAFRLFADGTAALADLDYEAAATAFAAALDVDDAFALARLRLGMTQLLAGDDARAAEAIAPAAAEAARLPQRDRLLAEALGALFVDGELDVGLARLEALGATHPDDPQAALWHAVALLRLRDDRLGAGKLLRGIVKRDPNFLPALAMLAEQLAGIGATDAAAGLLIDAAERNPRARVPLEAMLERMRREPIRS